MSPDLDADQLRQNGFNRFMRSHLTILLIAFGATVLASAQGTVPTFQRDSFVLGGNSPEKGGTTTIQTLLVPVTLNFAGMKPLSMDASADAARLIASPVFAPFAFPGGGGKTQYIDAMLRSTFPAAPADWHTILAKPEVKPITVSVPLGYGYVLTSKKSGGRAFAIADLEFVQKEIFKQLPAKQDGKLVLAMTHNTAFYALGDATVCCSWGTHGIDSTSGNSFVLASYLESAPSVVRDQDVQPLTQQLAGFFKDPLHDPMVRGGRNVKVPGNVVPGWVRAVSSPADLPSVCGGTGVGSMYFLLEPTNTNPKNNIPASKAFAAGSYHLQNVALLQWYTGTGSGPFSFPDPNALPERAKPCPGRGPGPQAKPTVAAVPHDPAPSKSNGHKLIGYWAGYGGPGSTIPLRELSPQWDIVLVAFSIPDKDAPEGTMKFPTPGGLDTAQFKADIAHLKSQGRKVMISLGGGGQHFTLADPKRVPNFVASVKKIVSEYGFDGIDIDFESPSLSIAPGDTDFRKPTTPSIVNLISAIRQLHDHFGKDFMVSLVPEGTQIPSGYPSYGGQFGSYLAIAHGLRDILSFMDVQDYNTPPLQGLDGEIYQPGTVDYHAAMTELVLQGFHIGGDPKQFFPPLPADKVAVGFLTGDTNPTIVSQAMDYLITGKTPAGTTYKLRKASGYPEMMGAMFWTIDADRRANYNYSNVIGPQLHGYPKTPSK
jgi:chitinase